MKKQILTMRESGRPSARRTERIWTGILAGMVILAGMIPAGNVSLFAQYPAGNSPLVQPKIWTRPDARESSDAGETASTKGGSKIISNRSESSLKQPEVSLRAEKEETPNSVSETAAARNVSDANSSRNSGPPVVPKLELEIETVEEAEGLAPPNASPNSLQPHERVRQLPENSEAQSEAEKIVARTKAAAAQNPAAQNPAEPDSNAIPDALKMDSPSETSPQKEPSQTAPSLWNPTSWVAPAGIQSSVTTVLLLSAISLAPAFIMMTTSFVRIFVVLGILRHGFGTQGIPGTQILAALALFMTFFIMFPTWERTWNEALVPYQEGALPAEKALERGIQPLRDFMSAQLERTGNTEEILLFWRFSSTPPNESRLADYTANDVPLHVLLPAFMLSELKTAFLIGVQILIPMLVIDLLISAILVSMGMIMLPPTMVSLPFKLLLFVLADGWRLVVEMLLVGFTG